jgi:hypothetical protein
MTEHFDVITKDQAARAMLAALQTLKDAATLGPLDAAAKYGPDFNLDEYAQHAVEKADRAIAQAEAAGIKAED